MQLYNNISSEERSKILDESNQNRITLSFYKYANIINIINNKEVIPELIQNECNSKEIFKSVR